MPILFKTPSYQVLIFCEGKPNANWYVRKICKYNTPPYTHKKKNKNRIVFPLALQPTFLLITFWTSLNPDDTALLHLSNIYHKHSPWEIIFNSTVQSNFPASDFGVNHEDFCFGMLQLQLGRALQHRINQDIVSRAASKDLLVPAGDDGKERGGRNTGT